MLILTGFVIRNYFIKDNNFWLYLNKLVYFFFLPLLLIKEIAKADIKNISFGSLIAVTIISTLIIILLLLLINFFIKINGKSFSSVFQGSIRYNSYILLGSLSLISPDKGLLFFGIVTIFMVTITNLMSVGILNVYCKNKKKSHYLHFLTDNLKNPLIIATIIGIILKIFNLNYSNIFHQYIESITSSTMALSLLTVGAGLQLNNFSCHNIKLIGYATIMKLLILPIISLIIMLIIPAPHPISLVIILYSSLPCASSSYILAKQMNGDHELMASIVIVTTILSMLTMPIFIYISRVLEVI
jgi:predicted permease